MLMLGLIETLDQLAMASSVRWYGHVFSGKDGHFLRKAIEFNEERRLKRTRKSRLGKEAWRLV